MYVTTRVWRVEFFPIVTAQAGADPNAPQIVIINADKGLDAIAACRDMVEGVESRPDMINLKEPFQLISCNPVCDERHGSPLVLTFHMPDKKMRPADRAEMERDARNPQVPQSLKVESVTRSEIPQS